MDGQKNFFSFSAFQNKYPMLTSNFLENMGLISAIKKSKRFLKNSEKNALSFILKQEKVCKKVYPFIKKPFTEHPSKCIEKWRGIFPNIIFNWQLIFSVAFKITSYIKLQIFHYTFLHHILYTNDKLFRLKYVDSPMCTFCNTTEETILHLFCECKEVKNFWINIMIYSWISRKLKTTIMLTSFDICFGYEIRCINESCNSYRKIAHIPL